VWQIEEAEGEAVSDEFLRHLSPARFEHINRYGRYRFASRNRVPKRPFPFQYDKKAKLTGVDGREAPQDFGKPALNGPVTSAREHRMPPAVATSVKACLKSRVLEPASRLGRRTGDS